MLRTPCLNTPPRRLLTTLLASVCLFTTAPATYAAAPSPNTQVPGYQHMMLGTLQITALYDGQISLSPGLLKGIEAPDLQALLARAFVPQNPQGVQTAVNAYLVNTGNSLVLIDSGAAQCFGPTLGSIGGNLRAAGYAPEQIDAVLLTHLHGDHACGLVDAQGNAVFPKATVYVPAEEAAYWLDKSIQAQAPEAVRALFDMAQASVAPYQTAQRFKTFPAGAQNILPGIDSVPLPGHTPGHGGYLLASGGQSLLVWGDVIHSHAVQFSHPEVAVEFDVNPADAIASRKRVLARAAEEKLWIAGAHLPFPGIGHVRTEAKGYTWVPLEYAPLPARP